MSHIDDGGVAYWTTVSYCNDQSAYGAGHTLSQQTRLSISYQCVYLIISIIQTLQSSIAKRLECMTRTLSMVNSASDSSVPACPIMLKGR